MSKAVKHNIYKILSALVTGVLCMIELSVAQEVKIITKGGSDLRLPPELSQTMTGSPDERLRIVKSWFVSRGYFSVNVRETVGGDLLVSEGCRYILNTIRFSAQGETDTTMAVRKPYSEELLEMKIQGILDDLGDKGYLFSEISIKSLDTDSASCEVSASLAVNRGKTFVSGEMLFPGLRVNNSEYLKRVSGSRDSILITNRYLAELRSMLRQSELFIQVGRPEVLLNERDNAVIVIPVTERSLNQFDGLLGYVPAPAGKGQIVGDLELSLWNVLAQGNGLELMFERLRAETTRLQIGVSQDWIGALPIGLGLDFDLFQNDTTYQSRHLRLSSYYLVGRGMRVTGAIGQTGSTSGDNTVRQIEPDGKKQFGELGFRYSNVDQPEVPTRGIRFGIQFGVSSKSVEIDSLSTFSQQYVRSAFNGYLPISRKSILAVHTSGYLLNAEQITDTDLIRFGGAKSMRGYSEEQFSASRSIWGDVEYRFMIDSESYLFAFGAVGSYLRPQLLTEVNDQFRTSDMLYSTGFGISYKIRIGRLKFTYAISPEESLGNGKVHVGIVTRL